MEIKNGKTKRAKEPIQSDFLGGKTGVGGIRSDSDTNGYNPLSNHEGCVACQDWINQFLTNGHPDFAKVLERLLEIEQQYLEYVDAHQGRLKARLEEAAESKKKFVDNVTALRLDIQAIVNQGQT